MNYYAKAIEILMDGNIDRDRLFCEIAKSSPGAIVKAYAAMTAPGWKNKAYKAAVTGDKVSAAKIIVDGTGCSLYEAKGIVEAMAKAVSQTPAPKTHRAWAAPAPETYEEFMASDKWKAEACKIATTGDVLSAVKMVKNETGCSLKEAKAIIDDMLAVKGGGL